MFLALLLSIPARAEEPNNSGELEKLRQQLAPYFNPPAELAGDFGKFRSPLRFDDGRPVSTAAEWRQRRAEILKTWHHVMGPWPPPVDKPTIEYLDREAHDNYTQQRIRVEVAPIGLRTTLTCSCPPGAARFRP